MGLFGKGKRVEAHKDALTRARRLVEVYRKDFSKIPLEFHIFLSQKLEHLAWHVENTAPSDLGDGQLMRELGEDLPFAELICSGRYGFETRQNCRTHTLEKLMENLQEILAKRPWTGPLPSLRMTADELEGFVTSAAQALEWFESDIPPRSGKFSKAEATRVVGDCRAQVAAMRTAASPARPVARAPQQQSGKPCPSCAFVNDTDAAFCNGCGKPITTGCSCGAANKPGAAFCKGCGASLAR